MTRTGSPVILVTLFLSVLWGLVGVASAGILDVTWTAPTANTDGSPLAGLDSYRIYYASGTSTPCPGAVFATVSGSTVTVTLAGLTDNTIYFVSVAAVSSSGNESRCSEVASATARPDPSVATAPAAPIAPADPSVPASAVSSVGTAQVVLDTDSFADTNGQALSTHDANWPVFANWNPLAIQGSPGFGPGIGGGQSNRRDGRPWTDDQWAEIVVGDGIIGTWDEIFVGLRAVDVQPAGRGYGGGFSTFSAQGYQIYRWDPDGTRTVLAVDPAANEGRPGDIINVQIVGSTITLTVTRGGAPLVTLSATDTSYSSGGTPMLWVCCGGATEGRGHGGSWRAGRVGS